MYIGFSYIDIIDISMILRKLIANVSLVINDREKL
jgi:hypothetical protein